MFTKRNENTFFLMLYFGDNLLQRMNQKFWVYRNVTIESEASCNQPDIPFMSEPLDRDRRVLSEVLELLRLVSVP